MAVTATAIIDQIEAVIMAITPTLDPGLKFRRAEYDDDPETSSAVSSNERLFSVEFGPWSETDTHTTIEFASDQMFLIVVEYPLSRDLRALWRKMRSDLRDIKSALDNETNRLSDTAFQGVLRADAPHLDDPSPGQASRYVLAITCQTIFHEAY